MVGKKAGLFSRPPTNERGIVFWLFMLAAGATGPLPFLYESTGVETFFRDSRDTNSRSRSVFAFHRPETLAEWAKEANTLRTWPVENILTSVFGLFVSRGEDLSSPRKPCKDEGAYYRTDAA